MPTYRIRYLRTVCPYEAALDSTCSCSYSGLKNLEARVVKKHVWHGGTVEMESDRSTVLRGDGEDRLCLCLESPALFEHFLAPAGEVSKEILNESPVTQSQAAEGAPLQPHTATMPSSRKAVANLGTVP